MKARVPLLALLILLLGALQAWDSHALESTPVVLLLIAAGLMAPALAIFSRDPRVRIAAVVLAAFLFLAARLMSPVSHNELHLATFVGALILFLEQRLRPGLRTA